MTPHVAQFFSRHLGRAPSLAILAAFLVSSCASSPPLETKNASPEQFAPVHSLLLRAVADQQIAGAVAVIARGDHSVFVDTVGVRDVEEMLPMQPDTIFRIASMTKPITSVAALILVEEGKLRLDDPVSRFIPSFKGQHALAEVAGADGKKPVVPVTREVTVHDLLTHTSGLAYGFMAPPELGPLYREARIPDGLTATEGTLAEQLEPIGSLPLAFQPGKAWLYGLSIDVLGRVIEVASGMSLDHFLERRILHPLKMFDTHFFLPGSKKQRLAALYTQKEDRHIRRTGDDPVERGALVYSASAHWKGPRTYFSGGAGLVSTAGDYLRFCRMLLGKGELEGARVLRPETVALLSTNQLGNVAVDPGTQVQMFGYGFGVQGEAGAATDPSSPGSLSWGGLYYTYFWIDPREELVGILMTQLFPADGLKLREEFKSLTYKALRGK